MEALLAFAAALLALRLAGALAGRWRGQKAPQFAAWAASLAAYAVASGSPGLGRCGRLGLDSPSASTTSSAAC